MPELRYSYLESRYSMPELPIHLVLSVKKPAPAYVCVGQVQNRGFANIISLITVPDSLAARKDMTACSLQFGIGTDRRQA